MTEQLVVALIVLAATGFLARRVVRSIQSARSKSGAGCDSGCGCAPAASQRERDPLSL
jgi:hypothetical protein